MSDRYSQRDMDSYNLSASQVKTHSKCPMQYWMRYIEGMENTKKRSKYVKLGSRVHETIEDLFSRDVPPPIDNEQRLKDIIRDHYAQREQPWLPKDAYNDGLKCCEKAAEVIYDRQPDIWGIEERVEFDIDRPDMETGVTAIMDVIASDEVWDWKTGRIRDDTPHEEKIQGATYMAAYYHLFEEPPEAVRFVYLKEGRMRTIDPTNDNWEYLLSKAKALLHAKKTGEFPANPGDHCYWCGYEFWCPESPVGMGNVPYEDY